MIGSATHYGSGQYSLYISNNDTNYQHSTVLSVSYATRKIHMPLGIYEVSYDWQSLGTLNADYMRVFLMPDSPTLTITGGSLMQGLTQTTVPAGAIPIDGGVGHFGRNSWQSYTNPLVLVTTTNDYLLVVVWYNNSGSITDPPGAIDNINIVPVTCPQPIRIRHRDLGNGCEEISWTDFSPNLPSSWIIEYGPSELVRGTGTVKQSFTNPDTICGLQNDLAYDVYVQSICGNNDTSNAGNPIKIIHCSQRPLHSSCFDYADLTSPDATCTYGIYSHYSNYNSNYPGPYANIGIRNPNNGYGSREVGVGSSHAIHSDISEKDSFTFYQLSTVPPGSCKSVRLGCRFGPYVCQATAYRMTVDTNDADLIIINYAVVLSNPQGHPADQQPRFIFEILDSNNNLINPNCAYANIEGYEAASSWNTGIIFEGGKIYWKDWAPIGIDISPYHGQNISVRITSFHCGQGAAIHCGYMYYVVECTKARITNNTCAGEGYDATFTAPPGFLYRWYSPNRPGWTSDQRSITVHVDSTTYYCDVFFSGDTNCRFTLTTVAVPRYPHSSFEVVLDTSQCKYIANVQNTSYASSSADDTSRLGRCEMFYWDFGDGTTSTSENPGWHEYQTAGTYTIMLVAKTSDDACADTVYRTIVFNPPIPVTLSGDASVCKNTFVHLEVCEPSAVLFQWSNGENTRGIDLFITDTITVAVHVIDHFGCEYDLVHHIDMDTVPLPVFEPSVFEDCVPYRMRITDINVESMGNTYSWDWGDGFSSINDSTNTHIYRKSGTYPFLCFIHSAQGCLDTIGLTAYVYEPPHSAFSWNPAVLSVFYPGITFINLTTPDYGNIYDWEVYYHDQSPVFFPNTFEPTYTWTGDMSEFTGLNLVRLMTTSHIPTHSGNTLTCYDTAEAKVLIVNNLLQFPNTVSPNGDGNNDIFEIKNLLEGNGYTDNDLYIYNHWGRRVYYKKNISKREDFWDPSLNNDPDGTYYYHFTAKGYLGHVQRNGVIQVVR